MASRRVVQTRDYRDPDQSASPKAAVRKKRFFWALISVYIQAATMSGIEAGRACCRSRLAFFYDNGRLR